MRACFIVSVCLSLSLCLYGQHADIVETQGIISSLHEQLAGRIVFTAKAIPPGRLQASDFLDSYLLTPKSDLFFTAWMRSSLTNALHKIAPALSADSLAQVGNFQFRLSVDGRLIYSSNLIPGAPSRAIRDTVTVLGRPLIDNIKGQGSWSESFWGRFMRSGGDQALTEGKHLLHMEIWPYLKLGDETKVGDLMAAGDLPLEVNRFPKIDLSTVHLTPLKPYDGFPVSNEKFDLNKIKALKGNIDAGVFKRISGIVVIKNGKLLVEEYFNGEARDSLHDPRSVGKSFASTITGIAIGQGHLKDEYQALKDFYALKSYTNYSPLKENTSLYELLTMSAAFDGNDDDASSPGNEENMYPSENWVKFTLDLPLNTSQPKGRWHYFTAGVVLLGDILNKSVPGGLEKYADETLFKPLGIREYRWEYTPQQVPNTAGGIRLKALDFAKYGQLYKDGGKWNGRQLIPQDWINKTFTRQKSLPERQNEYYGYLFWNKTYHVNNNDYEAWYCAGNGGNYIFIFKDQPLVVVITASAYGQPYAHQQVNRMMEEYILPAVTKGEE